MFNLDDLVQHRPRFLCFDCCLKIKTLICTCFCPCSRFVTSRHSWHSKVKLYCRMQFILNREHFYISRRNKKDDFENLRQCWDVRKGQIRMIYKHYSANSSAQQIEPFKILKGQINMIRYCQGPCRRREKSCCNT